MTKAEEVIEALDPLVVGEEVWFVAYDIAGNRQELRRGTVMAFLGDGEIVAVATGPLRGTMPTYQVRLAAITRDK